MCVRVCGDGYALAIACIIPFAVGYYAIDRIILGYDQKCMKKKNISTELDYGQEVACVLSNYADPKKKKKSKLLETSFGINTASSPNCPELLYTSHHTQRIPQR